MSRRIYLLGVGLALVALALAATDAALGPPPGVTEANIRRIKLGMLKEEVEAILGGPGVLIGSPKDDRPSQTDQYCWTGAAGKLHVSFTTVWVPGPADAEGAAFITRQSPQPPRRNGGASSISFRRADWPHPLARLRAWLRW